MATLGNYGERKESDVKDWGYYAHLSIYGFSVPIAKGKQCLEIGCGTGYGASFLREHGVKSVCAIDKDESVLKELRDKHTNVSFHSADLDLSGLPFPNESFDFVFSSNVFEHIAYIDPVLADCTRVLRTGGSAVIAVPPVITVGMLIGNAENLFHINNIPPWSWKRKLLRYFHEVEYFRHWVRRDRINVDGTIIQDGALLDDFVFLPDEEYDPSTITSVFLCKQPYEEPLPQTMPEDCPEEWRPRKVEAEARQSVFLELQKEREESTKWWHQEISSLLSWIEENRRAGVGQDTILDAVTRHLKHHAK